MNAITTITNSDLFTVERSYEYVMLAVGEVWRVTGNLREIHVISGTAWVSTKGIDTILLAGERYSLVNNRDSVVISAVNRTSLTLELIKSRR